MAEQDSNPGQLDFQVLSLSEGEIDAEGEWDRHDSRLTELLWLSREQPQWQVRVTSIAEG